MDVSVNPNTLCISVSSCLNNSRVPAHSAPQNIRSSVSDVSVFITWQPPADVPRPVILYRVTCVNVSANQDKPFYSEFRSSQQRNTTLTNLVPDTQYRVGIVGYVPSGVSDYVVETASASHDFTTDQTGEKFSSSFFSNITSYRALSSSQPSTYCTNTKHHFQECNSHLVFTTSHQWCEILQNIFAVS